MKVALFGIHKLLSDSLAVLEKQDIFPEVVVFPPFGSAYHDLALEICKRNNIRYIRPESVKDGGFIDELRSYSIDRIVVAGYHQIFPQSLLKLPEMGAINCHGGLLPEERGPIPWKWAVYENRPFTGIAIHQMTERVDRGEIFFKEKIELSKGETAETLFNKVAEAISQALPGFFRETELHGFRAEDMAEAKPGYRGQIPAELCHFNLRQTADELLRRVKAFSPRPGVFFEKEGQKILVKKMEIMPEAEPENAWIFHAADQYVKITDYEIVKQG